MSAARSELPDGIRGGSRKARRSRARAAKRVTPEVTDPLAGTLAVCTCRPTRYLPHECVRDDDESECG